MNEIKISVIIPVYNTSKYLVRCLESIVNQSLKEIEIICVNDGSTDNSLEILKEFQKQDERIIIINKKNEGASKARNAALKAAQGKYCLNIDSDDWIEQGYFKALYERAEKDNLDITISNIIFDYLENSQNNYILTDLNISDEKIISGNEYINIFLKDNFYGYTWNKLIKTKLYKENDIIYNEKIFMMEDVEVILRLSKHAQKIGKINRDFYHYIQHQSNGCQNISLKRLIDIKECFDSILKYFKNDSKKILKIKNRKSLTLIKYLKNSYILKKFIEYQEIQKEVLKENKKFPFLKFEYGKIKLDIIYCNILKLFPYIKIMNLLFILDSVIIEKLRKLKSK